MSKELEKPILSPSAMLLAGCGVVVFLVLFFVNDYSQGYKFERVPLWSSMMEGYRRKDAEWGFGYFVLPAVLVLLWVSRERYRGLEARTTQWGLVLIVLALFLYFGGYKANQKFIGYFSGQILLAGMILWFGGWELMRRAFWLWVLFGLIWPLTFLINPLSFPLRKLMTILTATVLEVVDSDGVIRRGTQIISAPNEEAGYGPGARFNLGVAAACSGLRSLFALSMVSLLYGYLSLERGWQRFVLLISAFPFAVIGNFVRMMMLYTGTVYVSAEFAIGAEKDPSQFHIGAGLMVFVVALFCMMATVGVLKGGWKTLRRKKTRIRTVASPAESSS